MDRREERRKHRLTYPGTTSVAESQQMLHDYRDAAAGGGGGTPVLERGGSHERADSREKDHGRGGEGEKLRRQTPPADGGTSSPRMQNRVTSSTPTKHLSASQTSANRAHQSNVRKQNLEKIRRDLQPFKDKRLSDPGFHAAGKETVDKKMLEELINSYGYNEVRTHANERERERERACVSMVCRGQVDFRLAEKAATLKQMFCEPPCDSSRLRSFFSRRRVKSLLGH